VGSNPTLSAILIGNCRLAIDVGLAQNDFLVVTCSYFLSYKEIIRVGFEWQSGSEPIALLAIGNWQSATGNRQPAIGNSAIGNNTMDDNKLANEEARRSVQHESVKAQVEGEVNAEIADRASQGAAAPQARRMDEIAGDFRAKAVDEVVETEHEVERSRGLARVSQIVDYIFFVLYALLGLRFLLALLAARSTAGFVQFIVSVTNPFYEPFRGIVASPRTAEGHTLLLPMVIAIIVYILLHLAINGLLRLLAHRKTQI
jgi:hypothetical protein